MLLFVHAFIHSLTWQIRTEYTHGSGILLYAGASLVTEIKSSLSRNFKLGLVDIGLQIHLWFSRCLSNQLDCETLKAGDCGFYISFLEHGSHHKVTHIKQALESGKHRSKLNLFLYVGSGYR